MQGPYIIITVLLEQWSNVFRFFSNKHGSTGQFKSLFNKKFLNKFSVIYKCSSREKQYNNILKENFAIDIT